MQSLFAQSFPNLIAFSRLIIYTFIIEITKVMPAGCANEKKIIFFEILMEYNFVERRICLNYI
jgi:hypothetical protein